MVVLNYFPVGMDNGPVHIFICYPISTLKGVQLATRGDSVCTSKTGVSQF